MGYEGETVHIEGNVDNREGTADIDRVMVELNQNVFVSSNAGVFRTYRSAASHEEIKLAVAKGQEAKFTHDFKIPSIEHQTAVGTLVANHYRVELSTQLGHISSENPCIYSPLFVLKKEFSLKGVARPRNLSEDLKHYRAKRLQVFKAPEYWFKKNMNLSVMNFRLEDGLEHHE